MADKQPLFFYSMLRLSVICAYSFSKQLPYHGASYLEQLIMLLSITLWAIKVSACDIVFNVL